MKKFLIGLLSCIMAGALSFGFAACDGEGNESDVGSANSAQSGEASNMGSSEISTDSSEISSGSSENEEDEVESSATDSSKNEDSTSNDTSNSTSDGTSEEDSSVEAHTHIWDNGKVTTPPTCEGKGVKTYSCACGETYTEEITATGHTYKTVVIAPTCEAKGYTSHVCDCGKALIDNYVDALGHNKTQHEAQAATCTEKGWEAYQTCDRKGCDYTTYVEIPALGHGYVDHAAQAATCTAIGWEAYETCSRCDYTTYEEIPALGHDYVDHAAQAATCTEKGWNAYETCSRCDYTTYVEIPAKGHSMTVSVEAKEPTCTEVGWDAYMGCDRCDYNTKTEIPTTAHNWVDGICFDCSTEYYSDGLQFTLSNDTLYYTVSKGTCVEEDIIIPSSYNGLPVSKVSEFSYHEMKSIIIPNSIIEIARGAFYRCNNLESITLPFVGKSPTSQEQDACFGYIFGYTSSSVEDPYINATYQYYKKIAATYEFFYYYYIPDSIKFVTVTGPYDMHGSFKNCVNLTEITIGGSVPSISGTFEYCTGLKRVEIGSSIEAIKYNAFYGCNAIEHITVPFIGIAIDNDYNYFYQLFDHLSTKQPPSSLKSVKVEGTTAIPKDAFKNCADIRTLEIGTTVPAIAEGALKGCTGLQHLTIPFAGREANDSADLVSLFGSTLPLVQSLTITSEEIVSSLGPSYSGSSYLGTWPSLRTVVLSQGVTTIGDSAFSGCASLASVVIPDSVTSLGDRAFADCSSLAGVVIPNSVTAIGVSTFYRCTKLTYNVKGGLKYLGNENNPYHYLADTESKDFTMVTIDDDCKIIGSSAFSSCSSLTSVEIGESVMSIDSSAFSGCGSLTSVEIPDSVTIIGDRAFEECRSLTSVVIGDSVTTIGSYAFYDCRSLTSVAIPDSVTTIGTGVFNSCSRLTNITFNGTVEEWNAITKGYNWDYLVPATKVVCSDGEVAI